MNLIQASEILVLPGRQRREHDPLKHQELVDSIGEVGLIHALTLEGKTLRAGGRRLRAIKEIYDFGGTFRHGVAWLKAGDVPYLQWGELTPLEREEIELQENLIREDLTWQETAEAENRLLLLREAQATLKGTPPPTIADIAIESRGAATPTAKANVSTSIILARNMHRPEVATAKSASEAMKAMLRTEETERNVEKATALGKDFLGGKHKVMNAEAITTLQGTASETYDIILTDPPYGMGADEFGDSGGGAEGAHFYDDSYGTWIALLVKLCPELFRVTKPDAHAYLFCDFENFPELRAAMTDAGWKVFRTPLIWFKPSAFRAPWPEQGPQRKYECILYAVKGNLKCTKLGGDVLTFPPDVNLGHQAQKPVALFQELLSRSARPGMKVLDPFCGTGPIFPAAHNLSVIATGVEKDPAAYAIAATRIEKLKEGT